MTKTKNIVGGVKIRNITAKHLADSLILFIDVVVACKQEPTVATGAFTSAMVTTDHNQVQCVTDTLKVVLLQLQHKSMTY